MNRVDEAKEEIRGGIMKRNINELKVFISIAIKGVERAKVLLSLIDSFENEDEMENFTKTEKKEIIKKLWEEYDKLTIEDIGNVVADLKKIIDKNQRINK